MLGPTVTARTRGTQGRPPVSLRTPATSKQARRAIDRSRVTCWPSSVSVVDPRGEHARGASPTPWHCCAAVPTPALRRRGAKRFDLEHVVARSGAPGPARLRAGPQPVRETSFPRPALTAPATPHQCSLRPPPRPRRSAQAPMPTPRPRCEREPGAGCASINGPARGASGPQARGPVRNKQRRDGRSRPARRSSTATRKTRVVPASCALRASSAAAGGWSRMVPAVVSNELARGADRPADLRNRFNHWPRPTPGVARSTPLVAAFGVREYQAMPRPMITSRAGRSPRKGEFGRACHKGPCRRGPISAPPNQRAAGPPSVRLSRPRRRVHYRGEHRGRRDRRV